MPDTVLPTGQSHRLSERYGLDTPPMSVWNAAIDLMLQHRSVRSYRSEALPEGTLEAMVAAAQSAATSSNLQTWSVIAVEDPARRSRLAALVGGQKHVAQAPLFLVWLADLSRAARLGEAVGKTMDGLPYLEAFIVAVIDAALAAQNATLAAESIGLGTVYIGAIRNNPEAVAAELELPRGVMPVFGLCVGYEDTRIQPAAVKPRLPQTVILHHEIYDPGHEYSSIEAYDETLLEFQAEQAMAPQPWSDLVRNRLGSVKALSGRDRLRDAINALGFELR